MQKLFYHLNSVLRKPSYRLNSIICHLTGTMMQIFSSSFLKILVFTSLWLMKNKSFFGSFPFVPPTTLCAPQLQSTCHYIVNHYVQIWHVRLAGGGGVVAVQIICSHYAGGDKQKRSHFLTVLGYLGQ